MKRIGILTAGGDTPALNATISGAVERANQRRVELYGLLRGYASLMDSGVPHVRLNPLFTTIPELDPCYGGTILGASRTYIDRSSECLSDVQDRLKRLKLDGLICIGGDGTINGMQPLAEFLPCVLAPKTIDNDLGLNYLDEANQWERREDPEGGEPVSVRREGRSRIALEDMVNFATPGYATAVFVVAQSIDRIRTTAESHRRIAVVEVMGRQSGYIALGSAYGQPDIILIPEVPVDLDALERRVHELYELQNHVVIVVGEGIVAKGGQSLGEEHASFDPAGNIRFSGAAESLKAILANRLSEEFILGPRSHEPASSAIFTRKVGHTQRGGRPIRFDRFHAAQLGGHAVDMLLQGQSNAISTLQWNEEHGFSVDSIAANKLRDPWGEIHPRIVHSSFYDAERFAVSELGVEYLKSIFTKAIGSDDVEHIREELFALGNLSRRYQSVNVDISKRVRTLND